MSAVFESGGKLVLRGGAIIAAGGPPPPAYLWHGYTDSISTIVGWWPSTDGTVTSYNVYQNGTYAGNVSAAGIQLGGVTGTYGSTPQLYFSFGQNSTNLANNTTYTFTVASVSPAGTGPQSSGVVVTTLAGNATASTAPTAPTTFSSPYTTPTGNTWTATVNTGEGGPGSGTAGTGTGNRTNCGLQYALDHCSYGDLIQLTAGTTYVSNASYGYVAGAFTPGGSTSSGQIYIQTSGYASLPAASVSANGTYVTTSNISNMATISFNISTNNGYGITVATGASYWRLVGINVTPAASLSGNCYYGVNVGINGGYNQSAGYSVAPVSYITLDRCCIGNNSANFGSTYSYLLHGVGFNCNYFAAYQNCVYGVFGTGGDSNGFICSGGQVHQIRANYIEAASEGVIYGGLYISQTSIPSDIEYCYNTNVKLAAWESNNTINIEVKNHFELKVGNRVSCHDNIHILNWQGAVGGQQARSFVIGARDQQAAPTGDGSTYGTPNAPANTCPWNNVTDVNIYNNAITQVAMGIYAFTNDYSATSFTARVKFKNNTIWGSPPASDGTYIIAPYGYGVNINGPVSDFIIDHNTYILNNAHVNQPSYTVGVYYNNGGLGSGIPGFADRATITNNVLDGVYAISGAGLYDGNAALSAYFTNLYTNSVAKNIAILDSSTYSSFGTNYGAVAYSACGFTSSTGMPTTGPSGTNWVINSGTYVTAALDGTAIGSLINVGSP